MKKVGLIGSASGWGAQIRSTEKGPSYLYRQGLDQHLVDQGIPAEWLNMIKPNECTKDLHMVDNESARPYVRTHLYAVYQSVGEAIHKKYFPFVLGGDHTSAIATWKAFIKARGDLGLLWIDAHMDAHTPHTTLNQACHGMPLAALLGYGDKDLIEDTQSRLKPENLVLIAVRNYEDCEKTFLEQLGVKVFYMDQVRINTIDDVIEDALEIVTKNACQFGVSIDLSAFDPRIAPGVGSPTSFGLERADTLKALQKVGQHPGFAGLEIAEFNPMLDYEDQTTRLIEEISVTMLSRN